MLALYSYKDQYQQSFRCQRYLFSKNTASLRTVFDLKVKKKECHQVVVQLRHMVEAFPLIGGPATGGGRRCNASSHCGT